jgi:hypothetical protein
MALKYLIEHLCALSTFETAPEECVIVRGFCYEDGTYAFPSSFGFLEPEADPAVFLSICSTCKVCLQLWLRFCGYVECGAE